MARPDDWNFAASIPDILATSNPPASRDFETFSAHQLGHCRRQLYLAHLGLRDDADALGRLQAGQLIHEFVEESLGHAEADLEVDPRVAYDAGPLRIVGRPTAYDPETQVVWHIKPRNGWYKFHPPNDRHLDQLTVYMRGLGATAGQLVYISMADLHDLRTWPPDGPLEFDPARHETIVERATSVRDRILSDGIARADAEVPFDRCDCYLCETETIEFPEPAEPSERIAQPASAASGTKPDDPNVETEPREEVLELPSGDPAVREADGVHVPAGLQELPLWVLWDGREKLPKAPWQEGSMYPCEWAADGEADPRDSYRRAKLLAELPVEELHRQWPFPDGDDLPEQVRPAVLLPHDPTDLELTVIDLDGVRDPVTGRVDGAAIELLEGLKSYTEVSVSGTGLHVYVRAILAEAASPSSARLSDGGRIELYDHSRFVASTWRHLEGTPKDHVARPTELPPELLPALQ